MMKEGMLNNMFKKKPKIILFSLILVFLIYVLNYYNTIRNSEYYYHRVLFPEIYFDFVQYFDNNSNLVYTYRDYGAFGSGKIFILKNLNGNFKISENNFFQISNDTIFFIKGNVFKRIHNYVIYTSYPDNRITHEYLDTLPQSNTKLKKHSIYKINDMQFKFICNIAEKKELGNGKYLFTYPGFRYDTLMLINKLK